MVASVAGKISKLEFGPKSIWAIDYSNCAESEMIRLVGELKVLIMKESKPQLILTVFNDNSFVSTGFYEHAVKMTKEVFLALKKMPL